MQLKGSQSIFPPEVPARNSFFAIDLIDNFDELFRESAAFPGDFPCRVEIQRWGHSNKFSAGTSVLVYALFDA